MNEPVATSRLLNDGWILTQRERDIAIRVNAPFDVHSALLAAGIVEDPYWRDRETELDWVHESEWMLGRGVNLAADELGGHWTLSFDVIDCVATIRVNGRVAARTESQFLRHDIDVGSSLIAGTNDIEITFHSNSAAALRAAERFPFVLPWLDWNCRIGHTNHLRKSACHAGWDWNIALMPLGLYGDVRLRRDATVRLDEIKVVQRHVADRVSVAVTAFVHGFDVAECEVAVSLCGETVATRARALPGENRFTLDVVIESPAPWWPAGHGEQTLHELVVRVDGQRIERQVGFREITLITTPDEIGARFAIAVNGREMFMRGANWIPADALPERCTPAAIENLLEAARDANMNMLRVWGGGRYEPDGFYDACDRLGILVWQDFMFACNHYPAADRDWLALVRREAHQQVRRLSSHACLALWCGDNELIGALSWFPETRADRDRYLANYTILNHALEEVIESEVVDVPFWPSSPSSGRLDFGDAWHDDRSGDMHFWDVWHSAKPFEHYRSVRPRFCSEFGFQSFPSMPTIERFAEPADRNVSSPVMDVHQRNVGGNARIVETIARYFRFPDGFGEMVFLSQVAQGLAMQTAIEFWRSCKPRTMGTLYWQLNDTWPVASWASLEHGGGWKVCHYLTRRFYAPVLLSAQPDAESGETVIWAVADCPGGADLNVDLALESLDGGRTSLSRERVVVPEERVVEVWRLPADAIPERSVLHLHWRTGDGAHEGENVHVPRRFKHYELPPVRIDAAWRDGTAGPELVLESDAPAFFVTVGLGDGQVWSDNAFTLLPGREKVIRPSYPVGDRHAQPSTDGTVPTIQHLAGRNSAQERREAPVESGDASRRSTPPSRA